MANYLQRLITEGKENLPALLKKLKGQSDDASKVLEGEVVGDLAKIPKQKILQDIEGEVIQPKAPLMIEAPIASKVDDIVASTNPELPLMLNPPVKSPSIPYGKIAAGGAALGIGAGLLYNSENDENKEITSAPMATPKNTVLPQINKESTKTSVKSVKTSSLPTPEKNPVEIESVAKKPEDDFEARLAAAQNDDVDRNRLFGLLKAAQMGGSALASAKADTSYADEQLKTTDFNVGNLKAGEALKEANNKILEEKEKRDPNSKISKLMQQTLLMLKPGMNVEGLSAAQVEKSFPSLAQAITTQEAIQSRKEQAALNREEMALRRSEKSEKESEKGSLDARSSVDKMVTNLYKSKAYEGYEATKAAQAALDNAIAKGDKTTIGSAFMMYAKIAQGDNSVVRESDMKNLAGSYNYASPSEMFAKLAAKAEGGNFTANELQQMKQVANLIEKVKGQQVRRLVNPISQRIKGANLNSDEIIDRTILDEFGQDDTTSSNSTTIPKSAIPEKVRIKNLKTGQEKTVDSATAQQILMNPNYQAVK
jgi:hypothetical protein